MGVKDVKEVEWIEREGPKDHFKTHFLKRMTPTPTWTKRHPGAVYPVLVDHKALITTWQIKFTTGSPSGMKTFAFRTAPNATVKFLAVAAPEEGPPTAWLIYFRHTAQAKDFKNDLLELGGGDYLFGRMQVVTQIARSGKKIGVIIPLAIGSSGEFAGNQAYVTQCLHEIEMSLYGAPAKRPLLAASNSDSIFQLQKFLQGCPQLVSRLKAIYDFDGSWRVGTGGISLIVKGVRTFRYDGAAAPNTLTRPQKEPEDAFLRRTMNANPARVPLPLSRWREHAHFFQVRTGDDPTKPLEKGKKSNEVMSKGDGDWIHGLVPTCMLQHGLANTAGI